MQIVFTYILLDYLNYNVKCIIESLCYRCDAQTPKSIIKDQNFMSLDIADAAYNANTSKFLGSKNITFTPNRIRGTLY